MTSLLSFELYFSYKQRAILILTAIALVYGFIIHFQDIGEGMQHIAVNSSYRITYFLTLTSVLLSFAAALFSINVLLKDKDHQLDQIINASKSHQLIPNRIFSVILSTLLVSFFLLIGLVMASVLLNLGWAEINSQRILPFMLQRTLWPWMIIVIPNILFISSVLIGVTLKWQNAKLTYATSFVLMLLFGLSMLIINAPITGETMLSSASVVSLLAIIDPFASSAFFEQTQFWSTADKNLQFISFDHHLIINRLLVIVISLFLLKKMMSHKPRLLNNTSVKNKSAIKPLLKNSYSNLYSMPVNINVFNKSWRCSVKQFLALLGFECKIIFNSWPIRILLALWVVAAIIGVAMVAGVFGGQEFSSKYATSASIIDQAAEAFSIFCPTVMVLIVADKIWQERNNKFQPIYAATKVSPMMSFYTKFMATAAIPLIMISLLIVICIGYQIIFKDNNIPATQIRWGHYLSLYYYMGWPQILSLILIFLVQTLMVQLTTANKYLGILVCVLVMVLLSEFISNWGLNHPLLLINQFPDLTRRYSELTGFGLLAIKFHWLAIYWGALAVVFLTLILSIWHKNERIYSLRKHHLNRSMILISIAFMCSLGIYIKANMPLKHDALSSEDQLQAFADYETLYSDYQKLVIPQISASTMDIAIYPYSQRVSVTSSNTLINQSNTEIRQVFITSKKPLSLVNIKGAHKTMQQSTPFWHVYLFDFTLPLLPNHETVLTYFLDMQSTAFSLDKGITTNATYFHQGSIEPLLGYASFMQLEGDFQRQQFGLPVQNPTTETDFERPLGYGKFLQQKRQFEATVSTHKSQKAITSGELIKTWIEDGRAFYHYKMDRVIYPIVGYFSANYQSQKFNINGFELEINAMAKHQTNIQEMSKATQATIDYMENHYGKYPYQSLRLIEVPKYNPFGGKASAGVIALNESLFLQNHQDGAAINNVARNTIHEVVHQWFGEKLVPKITYGQGILIESITKEIEATVLGQMYGRQMLNSLIAYNKRRYLSGRSFTRKPEPSLLHSVDEKYLSYGKGPLVLQQVKKHLNENNYHDVLKSFIEKHQNGMTATLADLVEMFMNSSQDPQFVYGLFDEV